MRTAPQALVAGKQAEACLSPAAFGGQLLVPLSPLDTTHWRLVAEHTR